MVSLPLITPGVTGMVLTVIASVCAVEAPQELFAVTETLPLVELAAAEMLFVVEEPVHPEGKVHV